MCQPLLLQSILLSQAPASGSAEFILRKNLQHFFFLLQEQFYFFIFSIKSVKSFIDLQLHVQLYFQLFFVAFFHYQM